MDTSVLIDAERRGLSVDEMLADLSRISSTDVSVSAMSLMELAHGTVRAASDTARQVRVAFLDDLRLAVPAIGMSGGIAVRLDGSLRKIGITVGMADAVIAATALEYGHAVATINSRHFVVVPGLEVLEL